MPMSRSTLLSATAALLVAAVIVVINPRHARAEAASQCTPQSEALQMIVPAETPAPMPTVPVVDAAGVERTIADLADGGGAVLNFWATWCAPCVREMPALDALHAELAEADIRVLAVSEDRGGMTVIEKFYREHGIENLEMLHDANNRLQRAAGLRGLPTTLLIDAEGREVARIEGIADYESAEMRAFLETCLGG